MREDDSHCTSEVQDTHKTSFREVRYRWHPWHGERVLEWAQNRILIQQTFRRGEMQNRTKTTASRAPVAMCAALAKFLTEWRQHTPYNKDEDYIFASPKLDGKQPMWGQTMNANFVKRAAVALGLIAEDERFGWHRFRHSLSTWANDATGDITVPQTMLRHREPNMATHYTHGTFAKALAAQQLNMDRLLAAASEGAR